MIMFAYLVLFLDVSMQYHHLTECRVVNEVP